MGRGAASVEESAVGLVVRHAPRLFGREREEAEGAAKAIEGWLAGAPISIVPGLDRGFRSRAFHRRLGVEMRVLAVEEYRAARAAMFEHRAVLALIGSVNRSGYVRGEALDDLLEPTALAMAALLTRLNDPVAAIGAAAWRRLEPLIVADRAPALARCLPIVEAQAGWVRARDFPAAERIRRLLRESKAGDRALWEGARSGDSATRLAACRLLASKSEGRPQLAAVLELALDDPHPRTRMWAAEQIANRKVTPAQVAAQLLPRLAVDPSPALRLTALRLYARAPDGLVELERAALDGNGAIRFFARRFLGRRGARFDYRRRALDVLSRPAAAADRIVGALGALSESGTAGDAKLIAGFASDPRPRVAREAERALRMLPDPG